MGSVVNRGNLKTGNGEISSDLLKGGNRRYTMARGEWEMLITRH